MRKFGFAVAAVPALTAAGVGLAGLAAAAPSLPVALAGCAMADGHGVPNTEDLPGQRAGTVPFATAYLHVTCSDDH